MSVRPARCRPSRPGRPCSAAPVAPRLSVALSDDLRDELAAAHSARRCCRLAEISALFHACGVWHLRGRGVVSVHLDLSSGHVARRAFSLLRELGVRCELRTYRRQAFDRATRYQLHADVDAHARELLDGHDLVKLEVLGDQKTLFPNMSETLKAAETLVKDGFKVMVYCSDDPIAAKQLEEIGCVAVMPLASLIGSGMGILNPWNLQIIIDQAKVPIVVDAGVGTASDAAIAMELGCHGVLMNTAIATAKNPVLMASAMKKAVEAGREAFLAGRMPKKLYSASPSSPVEGLVPPSKPSAAPKAA